MQSRLQSSSIEPPAAAAAAFKRARGRPPHLPNNAKARRQADGTWVDEHGNIFTHADATAPARLGKYRRYDATRRGRERTDNRKKA